MPKISFFAVFLACLMGVLFTVIAAKTPTLEQQQPLIDNWRASLNRMRREHSYFFADKVSNDVLTDLDNYFAKMRSVGLNIDSPAGFNALRSLDTSSTDTFSQSQRGIADTTRADRFNPFKLPSQQDQEYQNNLKRGVFGMTKDTKVAIDEDAALKAFLALHGDESSTPPIPMVEEDDYDREFNLFSTLQTTPTPEVPQHLIPSVQGLESNRGVGRLPVTTKAWCRAVLNDDYQVYPQRLIIGDLEDGIAFQDLQCERHIDREELVNILPVTSSLLSDDQLRYDFAKLGCSFFYRPLAEPTKLPCVSQCSRVRDWIRNFDTSTASPAQFRDRAVLQTIAWPVLLLSGQCEFANVYDQSNDPAKCIHPDDTSVFKTFEQAKLGRPTCKPYPATGGLCSGMLTNSYDDPSDLEMSNLIDVSTPLLRSLYALAPNRGSTQCATAMARQLCSRYTLSCSEVPITLSDSDGKVYAVKYSLPALPHRSVCTKYEQQCRPFLSQLSSMNAGSNTEAFQKMINLLSPQCDQKSPVGATFECNGQDFSSAYDLFPRSSFYTMQLGLTSAAVRTNNFTYATQYDQSTVIPFRPEINCPPPLVVPDILDGSAVIGTTSCANPCPSMQFTPNDYKNVSIVTLIISTISLVCAIFLVASFVLFKEIRQGNYFLQFLLCLTLICFSFAIGTYARFHPGRSIQDTFCETNTAIVTQGQDGGCAVQAFLILFAILAISAFFASSGFDLFLRVVLQVEIRPNTQQDYLLSLAYFFWGWTIPLLLTTIAAAEQSLGPGDLGVFYCFVNGRKNPTVPWAVAYLPLLVQLFIGCVSLSTTIYQLVRVAKRQQEQEFERQARDHHYHSSSAPTIRLGNYLVPLMLEFAFFVYLSWIVLLRAVVYFLEPKWNKNAAEYATCLLINKPIGDYFSSLQGADNATSIDCGARPKSITLGTWWFHQIFLASLGMITFGVLGTQRVYYQLWAAVIGYYFNIPTLLVWAATTQQAKIYGKRLARQRRERAKKLRQAGVAPDEGVKEGNEIVEQIKEQDKLVKEKLRQEQEEKQKKERERALQIQQQNLAMIAPHLRPLYMVQQRPRRQLQSLVDIAQDPDNYIGPTPTNVPDIFVVFTVQGDVAGYEDQYD